MADRGGVLLQVCANDHPPFIDICRYYEAAARWLDWQPVTLMLERRSPVAANEFHYGRRLDARLFGGRTVLVLCHRHRAWRAAMTSLPLRPPIVVVAHEFGLLRRRRRRWVNRWDRLLGRAPVTFAGVSPAVTEELARCAVPATLLPNGLDLDRVDAARLSRDEARRALSLNGSGFEIGVVGRLHPKKRPELAVAGFRRALPGMPGARLVFIGDGELRGALTQQAEGLPVGFGGFVPDAARYLAAFDLLLLPSGDREAFAMVALEAMAAGVPVLHGPAPGPSFVVGGSGRRFAALDAAALGDALTAAFSDWRSGDLRRQAAAARQRVEDTFSVPAAAARLRALAG
jgi:glycosyltransferase involved in cell wall biosynthesis